MNTGPTYTDQELIRRIAAEDPWAFRQLFDRYQRKVYYIAWRSLQSDEEAEDVVQEIFTKLWLGRNKLPEILQFNSYLNAILRNHLANVLRKKSHEEAFLADTIRQSQDHTVAAISQTELREFKGLLESALQKLSPRQQEIFRLNKMEGFRLDEIAEKLNISKETVKKHLGLAVEAVRVWLSQHGGISLLLVFSALY